MWLVNKDESIIRRWFKNSSEVTTGSADVIFIRDNSGTLEYLQSDESSWSTSEHNHSMTFTAGVGWLFQFTVPQSADGFNVQAEATHSDSVLPVLSEEHYVTETDIDESTQGTGASVKTV